MQWVHERENDQYRLRITFDGYPENPRRFDNIVTMICWDRKYRLGDEHDYDTPDDFFFSLAEELVGDTEKVKEMSKDEIRNLVFTSKELVIKPLYLYDHSGVAISTSSRTFRAVDFAGWDWGQVGWVYIVLNRMRCGKFKDLSDEELRQKAEEIIEYEVQIYNDYLHGNVYRYILEKRTKCDKCRHVEYEVVDSCGGFYGDDYKKQILSCIGSEYGELLD